MPPNSGRLSLGPTTLRPRTTMAAISANGGRVPMAALILSHSATRGLPSKLRAYCHHCQNGCGKSWSSPVPNRKTKDATTVQAMAARIRPKPDLMINWPVASSMGSGRHNQIGGGGAPACGVRGKPDLADFIGGTLIAEWDDHIDG